MHDFLRNKVSKIFVITAGQKIGLFYSNIVRIKKEEAEGCGFMYIIHSIFNNTSAPIGAKVADLATFKYLKIRTDKLIIEVFLII